MSYDQVVLGLKPSVLNIDIALREFTSAQSSARDKMSKMRECAQALSDAEVTVAAKGICHNTMCREAHEYESSVKVAVKSLAASEESVATAILKVAKARLLVLDFHSSAPPGIMIAL